MNSYEDPTQRLYSHNWSKEYKDNYDRIFGKKETIVVKLSYLNGDMFNKTFLSEKDLLEFVQKEGDQLVNWMKVE